MSVGDKIEFKETIITLDFPKNVNKELERLHNMYEDNNGTANKELQEWIRCKIDLIHTCYLSGRSL